MGDKNFLISKRHKFNLNLYKNELELRTVVNVEILANYEQI